eukprot:15366988-Ditylum_brightwellii.AAC.1
MKRPSNNYKGDMISFCDGTYDGKVGWINKVKPYRGNCIFVIVDMGMGEEKLAYTSLWSIAKHHSVQLTTFAEALVMQQVSI